MVFDETKRMVLRNALADRMAALKISDFQSYYNLIVLAPSTDTSPDPNNPQDKILAAARTELLKLIEGVAINETSFFRNREHFQTLREEVLPRLIRRHITDKRLRFWSAGCSTGQEPYSLAICLAETLRQEGEYLEEWSIEIYATDISGRVLNIARQGRYRNEEMRGLSPEQIAKYFEPISSGAVHTAPLDPSAIYVPGKVAVSRGRLSPSFEVRPEIRRYIKFDFLNLITPEFPSRLSQLDLVLCENVTIYFAAATTRKVIENIYSALDYGGFLFIGYSETLWQVSDRFKLINSHDTFYYQKPFPNEDLSRQSRHKALTGPINTPTEITDARKAHRAQHLRDIADQGLFSFEAKDQPGTAAIQSAQTKQKTPPPPPAPVPRANSLPLQPATSPEKLAGKAFLAEGKQKMSANEFEEALDILTQAIATNPQDDEVLAAMAELKLKLGDYEAALQLCKQTILINRLSEPAHLMLAMIYHKEGQLEIAVQEYKTTIFLNLENVIAYLRLGDIYRDHRQPREALREYRRALEVLRKKAPDEIIEDLSVGLLRQACEQNIAKLNMRGFR
ncbi:MAG: tetratricopeptide repeat protein [Chloroflexi bacterium]|nr:tetratricopeptide repeat protein [Chloroflexota bacterium]